VEELEKLIAQEGADTIAAFIGEPVMGTSGILPPPCRMATSSALCHRSSPAARTWTKSCVWCRGAIDEVASQVLTQPASA